MTNHKCAYAIDYQEKLLNGYEVEPHFKECYNCSGYPKNGCFHYTTLQHLIEFADTFRTQESKLVQEVSQ